MKRATLQKLKNKKLQILLLKRLMLIRLCSLILIEIKKIFSEKGLLVIEIYSNIVIADASCVSKQLVLIKKVLTMFSIAGKII